MTAGALRAEALPAPPDADPAFAYFLDFDGTLVPIADRPDGIAVPEGLIPLLARLQQITGGRIAVVSGRAIETIDDYLAPLCLPIAGLHGLERRGSDGKVSHQAVPEAALDAARIKLLTAISHQPLLELEDKQRSLALHYRRAPELRQHCQHLAEAAVTAAEGLLSLQAGKMVIEIKPAGINKGQAIEDFCAEPPFAAARPVMLGDDLTDDAAFDVVKRRGGLAILIGDRAGSTADYRLAHVTDCHRWLAAMTETRQESTV